MNCSEFTDEELMSTFVDCFADLYVEFQPVEQEIAALANAPEFAKAYKEAIRKKRSEGIKRAWQDPAKALNHKVGALTSAKLVEHAKRQVQKIMPLCRTPEVRAKIVCSLRKWAQTPEARAHFKRIGQLAATPENRARASERGKTPEHLAHLDLVRPLTQTPQARARSLAAAQSRFQTAEGKAHLELLFKSSQTEEARKKRRESQKEKAKTKEGRAHLDLILRLSLTPSAREKQRDTKHRQGKTHLNSTSKFKGVHWWSFGGAWKATIVVNGHTISLGLYDEEIEAARAVNKAALRYWGEGAFQNPIPAAYDQSAPIKRKTTFTRGPSRHNTSGLKGITWQKKNQKWMASINSKGRNIYLGIFDMKIDAVRAWNEASLKYNGPLAYQNPISESVVREHEAFMQAKVIAEAEQARFRNVRAHVRAIALSKISSWCRELRGRQAELSRYLNVSPASVSIWLEGKQDPSLKSWLALQEFAKTLPESESVAA